MTRIRRRVKRWWLRWKLEHGMATRGRQGPQFRAPPVQGEITRAVHEGLTTFDGHLVMRHLRRNPATGVYEEIGQRESHRCVTLVFAYALVDALHTQGYINTYKWHDWGEGVTPADEEDDALEVPCGEARTEGTQVEGATANIYKTVAEHTFAGPFAITEWGLFSADAAGVLLDRDVAAAINVIVGDKIQATYELTITAGG